MIDNKDINKIIDAISIKLDSYFNTETKKEYEIYGEEIEQGLVEPCFFVNPLKPSDKQILGQRYFKMQPFDIHYFPKSKEQPKREMLNIGESLFEVLEYIEYNGELFRGTNMSYQIIDNVLHFFVDYNYYHMREKEKDDYIKNLKYSRGGKK